MYKYYLRGIMKVTSKGQVTIPVEVRNKLEIRTNSEVEFVEEKGRVYLQLKAGDSNSFFKALKGSARSKLTTDEILKLTRG